MDLLNKFNNPDKLAQVKLCVGNTGRKRSHVQTKRQKVKKYAKHQKR